MATTAPSILPRRVGTPKSSQALVRFAWLVVGYNVLVILWGALVRATGSGAGCGNHWPLCNGQVIPLAPRIDTLIEFTHRMMVGGASFAVLALLAWTFAGTEKGAAARVGAVMSMILLINEAVLGAVLVKLGYVTGNQSIGRVIVLSVHLSNTLLLVAALTLTACFLSTGETRREMFEPRDVTVTLMGLFATIVVGVSGSLAALGDTLFPAANLAAAMAQDFAANSPWLLRVRWIHPASAMLAAGFVAWLAIKSWVAQRTLTQIVLGLLAFQFLAGLIDIALLAPVWMQVLHLLGADVYWIALMTLAARWMWPASQVRPKLQAS